MMTDVEDLLVKQQLKESVCYILYDNAFNITTVLKCIACVNKFVSNQNGLEVMELEFISYKIGLNEYFKIYSPDLHKDMGYIRKYSFHELDKN